MASIEELDKAIGAHGMWKTRLKNAIATGVVDTPVEVIRQDTQCTFGKWLFGPTLSSLDKASAHFKTVRDLHAEFHRTAARVAELALANKKTEADALMNTGGDYAMISSKLTQAMMEWKKVSK